MAKNLKITFLIYTYDRIDDAKINMEIINELWEKSGLFYSIKIVHSYNGKKEWYPKKYLENVLIRRKNPGHFQGAAELIDSGMAKIHKNFGDTDYVIVLAADTWLVNIKYVHRILQKMSKNNLYLATCPWGLSSRREFSDVGMALDFFIIDQKWAKKYKMFPINFADFAEKYWDLILFLRGGNVSVEKLAFARYLKAIFREFRNNVQLKYLARSKIYQLTDREPVHTSINRDGFWIRKMYWPKMGLLTHHEAEPKRKILKKLGFNFGKNIQRLVKAKDTGYHNKRANQRSRKIEWKT